jgi:hypothetical protein
MNVFTNLKAYTLPVVLSAVKQVGWPARISNLPQPQRGQLQVALGVELAYPLASLLSQVLSGFAKERGFEEVGQNSEQYRDLAKLRTRNAFTSNAFARLERLAVRWPLRRGKGEIPSATIKFEFKSGHLVNVDTVRREIPRLALESDQRTAQRWCDVYKAFIRLRKDLDAKLQKAELSAKARCIFDRIMNVERSSFAYKGSPIELLKSREGEWWASFIGLVAKLIEADLNRSIYQIALRDPNILWAIYQVNRAGDYTGTAAVMEVVHTKINLERVWRGMNVSEQSPDQGFIRLWKHRLGEEDRQTQEWIRTTGGENHPYDFYATEPWQHPELFTVPRNDEFDSKRDDEKARARKRQAEKMREERQREFMAERPPVRVARLRLKPNLRKELLEVLNLERAPVPADQDYSRFAASNVEP